MNDDVKYPVRSEISAVTHVTEAEYQALYRRSVEEPEQFWAEQAGSYLDWFGKWDRVGALSLFPLSDFDPQELCGAFPV